MVAGASRLRLEAASRGRGLAIAVGAAMAVDPGVALASGGPALACVLHVVFVALPTLLVQVLLIAVAGPGRRGPLLLLVPAFVASTVALGFMIAIDGGSGVSSGVGLVLSGCLLATPATRAQWKRGLVPRALVNAGICGIAVPLLLYLGFLRT